MFLNLGPSFLQAIKRQQNLNQYLYIEMHIEKLWPKFLNRFSVTGRLRPHDAKKVFKNG